jgi:Fe-coproporphyrin III synthase
VSAVVEVSGDVRPCFFHPPIGNTAEGTLAEILNSPRAIAFRERLSIADDPICRRCVCSLYVSAAQASVDADDAG